MKSVKIVDYFVSCSNQIVCVQKPYVNLNSVYLLTCRAYELYIMCVFLPRSCIHVWHFDWWIEKNDNNQFLGNFNESEELNLDNLFIMCLLIAFSLFLIALKLTNINENIMLMAFWLLNSISFCVLITKECRSYNFLSLFHAIILAVSLCILLNGICFSLTHKYNVNWHTIRCFQCLMARVLLI